MRRNLLALGSAAVLAVYAAGYERTRDAAARFADESEHRRRPPSPNPEPPPPTAPATAPATSAPATKAPVAKKAASPKRKPKPTPVEQPAAVETATASKDSASAPITTPMPAIPVAPVAPPVAVAPPSDSATPPPATDSARATRPAPKWKDGVYSAWGTSRHGDLEASVEIKDGRIVNAWISQCWTRYPCSRIEALPPQVVQRQSADVDVISRVTQSSEAFYEGVMLALAKAKP